jgi:hypothetical protein
MKKIFLVLLFLSNHVMAMGIAGKSGDELLYLYVFFVLFALFLLGLDYTIKFAKVRFRLWKYKRRNQSIMRIN